MAKRRRRDDMTDSTPIAVAVAALVAGAAIQTVEIIYGNIRDAEVSSSHDFPLWRVHMGSAFAGSVSFVVALFLLENLGKKSKLTALRSVFPWLPVVALTGLATAIHIPIYLVILAAAVYSPWAYSRTRALR
jgi:hypothetical protein